MRRKEVAVTKEGVGVEAAGGAENALAQVLSAAGSRTEVPHSSAGGGLSQGADLPPLVPIAA